MKIMICGSMAFAREMVKAKEFFEKEGFDTQLPYETELHLENPVFVDSLEDNLKYCIENDVIRKGFDFIANSDAVVVLNYPRKGVEGYIGTSTLMEIGIAYFLKKKIYLLNDVLHFNEVRWAHEIRIMQPIILHGDLSKVK